MTPPGSYFFLLVLLMNALTIEAETKDTKLILFLLDGFRWDYFDQTNVNLPGFKRLFNKGVRANYTTSDFPTLSIPNYYTIMTGLHTESHGMIDNYMYDENIDTLFLLDNLTTWANPAWWQGGEPLWVTTEKQDKSAYMFYWPGCDVEIRDKKPTFCKPYFNDNGNLPGVASMSYATNEAIQLFKNDSADMVGIYVETSDYYGHAVGPSSPLLYQKLQEIDGVIGQLLDNLTAEGLDDEVVIMIFSDHGMTDVTSTKIIQLTDYIDINDLRSPVLGAGATCSIWPKDDKMDKVYNATIKAKTEKGHIEVYKKDDIPDKWYYKNNDRVAPITVLADLGYFLLQGNRMCDISEKTNLPFRRPYERYLSEKHLRINKNCSDCEKPFDRINELYRCQDTTAGDVTIIRRPSKRSNKAHGENPNNITETKSSYLKYNNKKTYQMIEMISSINGTSKEDIFMTVERRKSDKSQPPKKKANRLSGCEGKPNINQQRKNKSCECNGHRASKNQKTSHNKSTERSSGKDCIKHCDRKVIKDANRKRQNSRGGKFKEIGKERFNSKQSKWKTERVHRNNNSDIKRKKRSKGNGLIKVKYNNEESKNKICIGRKYEIRIGCKNDSRNRNGKHSSVKRDCQHKFRSHRNGEEIISKNRRREKRSSKERSSKVRSSKDRSSKGRSSKERSRKGRSSKERSSKGRRSKERSSKGRSSKGRSSKERSSKGRSSKERSSKGRSSKEISSMGRSSKERSRKERSSKKRSNKGSSKESKSVYRGQNGDL